MPARRKTSGEPTAETEAEIGLPDEWALHADRSAVSYDMLRRWLMGINPAVQQEQWFKVVRAIAATPLRGGETPANEERKRRLAHLFMNGELYRGQFIPPEGAAYRTPDEIDRIFDAPERGWGYTFGTIVYMAREKAGWDPNTS